MKKVRIPLPISYVSNTSLTRQGKIWVGWEWSQDGEVSSGGARAGCREELIWTFRCFLIIWMKIISWWENISRTIGLVGRAKAHIQSIWNTVRNHKNHKKCDLRENCSPAWGYLLPACWLEIWLSRHYFLSYCHFELPIMKVWWRLETVNKDV